MLLALIWILVRKGNAKINTSTVVAAMIATIIATTVGRGDNHDH